MISLITDDWSDYEARARQHDAKATGDDGALLRSIALEAVGVAGVRLLLVAETRILRKKEVML